MSHEAIMWYHEAKGIELYVSKDRYGHYDYCYLAPDDPDREPPIEGEAWFELTLKERQKHNEAYANQRFYDKEVDREDPVLIEAIKSLGTERASGRFAKLKIVRIPEDVKYTIEEYDGAEWIAEVHRTWE